MSAPSLLPPDRHSLQRERLAKRRGLDGAVRTNPERVYAAEWIRMNRRVGFLLEHIVGKVGRNGVVQPGQVSRRDEAVAACVVQWLGTSVGGSFVRTCEEKIWALDDAAKDQRLVAASRRDKTAPKRPIRRAIDLGGVR